MNKLLKHYIKTYTVCTYTKRQYWFVDFITEDGELILQINFAEDSEFGTQFIKLLKSGGKL